MLVENGADVNIVNKYNNTALILAITKGDQLKDVKSLYKTSFQNKFYLLIQGFEKVAELLIQKGTNVNIVGVYGKTATVHATEKGK